MNRTKQVEVIRRLREHTGLGMAAIKRALVRCGYHVQTTRLYLEGKLQTDPLVSRIEALEAKLGVKPFEE